MTFDAFDGQMKPYEKSGANTYSRQRVPIPRLGFEGGDDMNFHILNVYRSDDSAVFK